MIQQPKFTEKLQDQQVFPFECRWEWHEDDYMDMDANIHFYLNQLKTKLYWIKGYKYWRCEPEFTVTIDFENNKKYYKIYSRLFAAIERIPDAQIKEVELSYAANLIEEQKHALILRAKAEL